jgi:hypothetical protein
MDMINQISKSLLILAVGGLVAIAQTTTTSGAGPGVIDPGHPRVNQVNGRETNQQNRIANGVKNGSLSPKQTVIWRTAKPACKTAREKTWRRTTVTSPRRNRMGLIGSRIESARASIRTSTSSFLRLVFLQPGCHSQRSEESAVTSNGENADSSRPKSGARNDSRLDLSAATVPRFPTAAFQE